MTFSYLKKNCILMNLITLIILVDIHKFLLTKLYPVIEIHLASTTGVFSTKKVRSFFLSIHRRLYWMWNPPDSQKHRPRNRRRRARHAKPEGNFSSDVSVSRGADSRQESNFLPCKQSAGTEGAARRGSGKRPHEALLAPVLPPLIFNYLPRRPVRRIFIIIEL